MAREGLKLALREALRLAVDKGQATLNQALSVRTNGPTAIFTRSA